jgi:transposase
MQKKDLLNLVTDLTNLVLDLRLELVSVKQELVNTKEELRILKEGKNSKNSSMPPSTDLKKPNQSLRVPSGKKSGGQLGHKGSTLEMKAIPDEIIQYIPFFCNSCGADLTNSEAILHEKRQVVDIPPVATVYTEHQVFKKQCQCGCQISSPFPAHVSSSIQYGAGIETMVAYMSARQYMPYARMCEYFGHIHQLPISQGSIANILERFAEKSETVYQYIKECVAQSDVVGADETGCKINGNKYWTHTWQSSQNVLLSVAKSRGYAGIHETFPDGLPNAILVSDAWAAQLGTIAKSHQLCMAHLLRDLNYFIDVLKDSWSVKVKELIDRSLKLKNRLNHNDYHTPIPEREEIEKELDALLGKETTEGKITAFRKRLIKNRNYIFQFLKHHNVPPDNNASERAIRNVKVKQKVSCQFKSELGAQIFVKIRSVIDTCIKRNIDIFNALKLVANYRPE